MFTNKKREGINRFVCDVSLYVAETPKASIKYHKPPLPIIPFGIVAYGFVGQPFSKQLYITNKQTYIHTYRLNSANFCNIPCFILSSQQFLHWKVSQKIHMHNVSFILKIEKKLNKVFGTAFCLPWNCQSFPLEDV